jgi:hypothetical protein
MSDWDVGDEPELVGYVPGDGRPLRSHRMLIAMRIVVVLGITALILPGVVGTLMINARDAAQACKLWVRYEYPGTPSSAQFELLGAHGSGWQCYTGGSAFGGQQFITTLGWIPGPPMFPTKTSTT